MSGPTIFEESAVNSHSSGTDKSANRNKRDGDEGVVDKIARTIAPPSREVSDDELADPGAHSPAPKPATPAERVEAEQRPKNK